MFHRNGTIGVGENLNDLLLQSINNSSVVLSENRVFTATYSTGGFVNLTFSPNSYRYGVTNNRVHPGLSIGLQDGSVARLMCGVGFQYHSDINGYGADTVFYNSDEFNTNNEIFRTVGKDKRVGIGTAEPKAKLHVYNPISYDQFVIGATYSPSATGATFGNAGSIVWDDDYIYIKTSVGWKRSNLSTF